jgi:hypothetical protein
MEGGGVGGRSLSSLSLAALSRELSEWPARRSHGRSRAWGWYPVVQGGGQDGCAQAVEKAV